MIIAVDPAACVAAARRFDTSRVTVVDRRSASLGEGLLSNGFELDRLEANDFRRESPNFREPRYSRIRALVSELKSWVGRPTALYFAEAEYIARVRSGVKGHFSYREIAWQMKLKLEQLEPELGRLIEATPPWVEDPLKR